MLCLFNKMFSGVPANAETYLVNNKPPAVQANPESNPYEFVNSGSTNIGEVKYAEVPEEQKTIDDYMQEYQEEADLNDRIALSGIDPRGYSSRALKALRSLTNYGQSAKVVTGGSNVAREQAGQNLMENIGTLMDPTAWMPNTEGNVDDPGAKGGEMGLGTGMYTLGQKYVDSKGNIWRFRGVDKGAGANAFEGTMGRGMSNLFDFVGTTKMEQEAAQFYKRRGQAPKQIYK